MNIVMGLLTCAFLCNKTPINNMTVPCSTL